MHYDFQYIFKHEGNLETEKQNVVFKSQSKIVKNKIDIFAVVKAHQYLPKLFSLLQLNQK